jgi:hypothetical protein
VVNINLEVKVRTTIRDPITITISRVEPRLLVLPVLEVSRLLLQLEDMSVLRKIELVICMQTGWSDSTG